MMGSADAQAVFFGKLSALLRANLPLLRAMEVALERVEAGELREALQRIIDRAYQGSSLTDAFNLEAAVFSSEVLTLIESGEETGDLEHRTQALADGLAAGTFEARPAEGEGAPPLDRLVKEAAECGATDVHATPVGADLEVRFRIGGKLSPRETLTGTDRADFVERAHFLCGLPPGPVGEPCAGEFDAEGMRVAASICPVAEGESVVLRLTPEHSVIPGISDFGFTDTQVETLKEWTRRSHGIVAVSGLPGSGRENLLRCLTAAMDVETTRVFAVTVAPMPRMEGVSRIAADRISRAAALRAAMEQDLDTVLLDEIADPATATMAARLARTGHLVLAGVTAIGGSQALSALLDRGFDPEDVAELIIGVAVLPSGRHPAEMFAVDREKCLAILSGE